MNFIWELLLLAGREQVKQENLRFIPAQNPSPYQELSMEILNIHSLNEIDEENPAGAKARTSTENRTFPIEANPLYRFNREFNRIFDINLTGMKQTRELFFDICMHYIAGQDLLSGRSRYEYYLLLLEQDLEERFDEQVRESFNRFSSTEKDVILHSFYGLCRTGNGRQEFRRTVTSIYPKAIIYESTDSANELLVYLGKKETEEERSRIYLLTDLLLPMQETVHIFYDHHFGIIGVDETMVLDEMVIF